eukprot:GFUD01030044.1.p1 GENE.GFUD01030044.1~~GFUD01030044.1.p1  ORF type:complete len:608 (+),score=112.93 GFUD01030044.1:51-1826(+)
MEADDSCVIVGDRKSLRQVYIATEAETDSSNLRHRYSSGSSLAGTPNYCITPPTSTSTPDQKTTIMPSFSTPGCTSTGYGSFQPTSEESIHIDSGYSGSNRYISFPHNQSSSSDTNTSLWDTIVSSPVQNLRQKLRGRPSYLDKGHSRSLKIQPQHACFIFAIIITSIGFASFISYKGGPLDVGLAVRLSWTITWQWKSLGAIVSLTTVSGCSYYRLFYGDTARLVHVDSRKVDNPVRRKLAKHIEGIIDICPELKNPRYIPTFWAADQWTNMALLIAKQRFDKSLLRRTNYNRELLTMTDGGTVSIDFPADSHLPVDAPLVIFLHTITGSSSDTGHYMRCASRRGWRSCVFNRRGHGRVSLTTPNFNVMGDVADTKAQVDFVIAKYSSASYVAMVGISAGSGLLVTYLGKEGDNTPVRAACSLCPAYDISQAFTKLAENYPMVDRHILTSMKKCFIRPNKNILSTKSQTALENCTQATTIDEFLSVHFPFAGYDTLEEYFCDNNPMEWVEGIVRPVMIVNSEDDMVCLPKNIREDIITSLGGVLLLRTRKGAHIAFNEGILGTGCYLSRITMDFLDAARLVEQKGGTVDN